MLKRLKTQYLSILIVLVTLGVLAVSTAKAQGVLDPRLLRQNGATSGQALKWNGTVWAPANDTDTGITTLNGLTGTTQTFAEVDDTNVTVTIGSTGTTHTWTLGWTSVLALGRGGTGADLSATGGSNQFVKQSSAGGVLTVGTIGDADVPNDITIDLASTATALASNPTDCSAGQYATAIAANGNLTCAQIAFSEISGSVTDGQVPNTITLDNITQITTRPHSSLTSLTADDHTQYGLLAGRSGGQTLIGGTAASNNLVLESTANATKGIVLSEDPIEIDDQGGIRLREEDAGGDNYFELIAPSAIASNFTWTAPNANPASTRCVEVTSGGVVQYAAAACAAGGAYATVDDEDTPLTQRTTLNFEGAGVTCADDTDQTTCTIADGGSWTLAATWSHAVSGDTAFPIQFTGLAGANDIQIIADAITASVSGSRQLQVSTTNGSSYSTTSGDYVEVSATGVRTNRGSFCGGFTDSTAARSLQFTIQGANITGSYKSNVCVQSASGSTVSMIYVVSTDDIDAVQLNNQNGGNATGGIIYVLTR